MGFGIQEIMFLPLMLLLWVAPIAVAVWLLVTLHRMSRDVGEIARGVRYLADRATREDGTPR